MSTSYYKTKESVQEYIRLAEGHSGKKLIEKLIPFLSPDSSLLEIGSGPGTDWKILSSNFKVTGSDYSAEFIEHLSAQNPDGEFLGLNAVTLATSQKYDGIFSNKVLHHLDDSGLQSSIKRQYEILNPGGVICHSFWKGDGSEVFKGLFVNYHMPGGLSNFFAGYFEILFTEEYKEFENGDSLLLIGKKK